MSSCYCDYEDQPAFYSHSNPKARKSHECTECGRAINKGETYESYRPFYPDGINRTYKTCSHCIAIRDYVKAHVPCFCWYYEGMLEDAYETVCEYAAEAPGLFMGFGRLLISGRLAKEK